MNMNKSTTKISVIVPVYNIEKYLHKCIDSILSQSFMDFELLLIDDGSIDNSGKICDEYHFKDVRIKVFHKENSGVSSARNIGLENAKGVFICFVDSDDTIDEDFLLHLVKNSEGFDLVVSGFRRTFFGNNKMEEVIPKSSETITIHDIGKVFSELDRRGLTFGVCGKLLNKSTIVSNSILFNKSYAYGEDIIFMLQYFLHISSLKVVSYAEYNYFLTESVSLSRRRYSYEIENEWLNHMYTLLNQVIDKFSINDRGYLHILEERYLLYFLASIYTMYLPNTSKTKQDRLLILQEIHESKRLRKFSLLYSKTLMSIASLFFFRVGLSTLTDSFFRLRFRN